MNERNRDNFGSTEEINSEIRESEKDRWKDIKGISITTTLETTIQNKKNINNIYV